MKNIDWTIRVIIMFIHFLILLYSLKLEYQIGNELKDLKTIRDKLGNINICLIVVFTINLFFMIIAVQ